MYNLTKKKSQYLDVKFRNRKSTLLAFLRFSVAVVQESRAIDAAVGDAAGPDQHAVACAAAEITSAAHRAVVFPFGAPKLQTQPKAGRKVGSAEVTDEGHLIGAGEQDLHAHVETDLTIRHGGGAGHATGETAAEGAPTLALRVGTAPLYWKRVTEADKETKTD